MSNDRVLKSLRGGAWLMASGLSMLAVRAEAAEAQMDLGTLSIEQLAQLEVTSVSKRSESLSDAAAAIYVITQADIIRSGATSLPEMLRLAPNLQVAQVTASHYAITARGFNGGASDKLLVLVDGRSIYIPFTSSVNWDLEEISPEEIERIEVVSGPGGTLWGANAVNGVINIITRKSSETQGLTGQVAGGNAEFRERLQYGGTITDTLSYRAYIGAFRHGDTNLRGNGTSARDGWHKVQGGFRVDWAPEGDLVTVQGDIYDGAERPLTGLDQAISGHNVLARWTHKLAGGSSLQVQAYYDHLQYSVPNRFANALDTYDLQAQHNFTLGNHEMVWGGGYRVLRDDFPTILSATQAVTFVPPSRTFHLWNLFAQDSFSLTNKVRLIAGVKVEKEPYTGVAVMPNLRLSWAITENSLLWLAASRAVRVPSRLDRDVNQRVGSLLVITGGDMQPVKVNAYELGYRAQPLTKLSFSVSAFFNQYPNLRSAELTNGGFPVTFANGMEGETYGVEAWANYDATSWWRLTAGANWLHKDLRFKPGSSGAGGLQIAGNDPDYQLSLRSAMTHRGFMLDLGLRQVSALPAPASPAYAELDARIAWAASRSLELSVTGSNLLHAYHAEFGTTTNTLQVGPIGVRIQRSVLAAARWKF